MLLLTHRCNVSERATEQLAVEDVAVKWCLGLADDQAPHDHATLTTFKRRLLGNGG